jgi:hypothetical protein
MRVFRLTPSAVFHVLALSASLLLASGCSSVIVNMTSETVSANPSNIYTITAKVRPNDSNYVRGTVKPRIVIAGKVHDMVPSPLGEHLFEYDFTMPPGVTEVPYYIVATYQVNNNGIIGIREKFTPITRLRLTDRYVYTMDANRAPVGATVGVVGRGFTPQDVVYVDNVPARTVFESTNALSFAVPAVPAGRSYRVSVVNPTGTSPVGTLRVDGLAIRVTPSSLHLATGQNAALTFTLPSPAPAGGLLIDVTTDIPRSVIMPEVIVPAGSTSVTVTVQGGAPGSGALFVSTPGAGELTVPVMVGGR